MSEDAPSDAAGQDPSARIRRVFLGQEPFARGSDLEPSLLPQLARLCPASRLGEVLAAAHLFGREGGNVPAWPQIWESVIDRLAARFTDEEFDRHGGSLLLPAEVATHRAVAQAGAGLARAVAAVDELGRCPIATSLDARLLAIDPSIVRLQRVLDAMPDPAELEPEPARAVLEAAHQLNVGLDPDWVDRAVHGDPRTRRLGRAAHVMTAAHPPQSTHWADEVVAEIAANDFPLWFLSMAVSRLRTLTSSPAAWSLDSVLDEVGVWMPWMHHLIESGRSTAVDDVNRSHPHAHLLDGIEGPQPATAGLARDIVERWGAASEAASLGPRATGPDERRLGIDAFLEGRLLSNALVADRETTVVVSVAKTATAQVAPPIPLEWDDGVDMRQLPVKFIDLGRGVEHAQEHEQMMIVHRDPEVTASVAFKVTPTDESYSAMIAVFEEDGSTIVQAASMTAAVVPSLDDAERADRSISLVWVPINEWSAVPGANTAAVVTDGRALFGTGVPLSVDARTPLAELDAAARGLTSTAGARLVHPDQTSIAGTLAAVARAGYRMRIDLDLDRVGSADRIQVATLVRNAVFPLELAYDGEPPDLDAELCDAWVTEGDAPDVAVRCETCASRPLERQRRIVCPGRFWGLSKVIEHHHADESTTGADFVLRVLHTETSTPLSPPTTALVGASSRVVEALTPPDLPIDARVVVDAVRLEAGQLSTIELASTWASWLTLVHDDRPTMLIIMPHQELVDEDEVQTPALEIGGEFESTIREGHVRRPGADPGPVVMLIGCWTGVEQTRISSFASRFRRYSPVVIATYGEIIAAEAPSVVAALLRALLDASSTAGATVGSAVRTARRSLVAESRLAGLQLVLHGNADWPAN